MKLYRKFLRKLFAQAIRFEVSALQTRMSALETENRKLKVDNEKLRDMVKDHSEAHNKNIAVVVAQSKAAFQRIGHKW